MKVLISQPMNGRTTEEILETRRKLIEKFNKIHIDVADSYFTDDIPKDYQTPGLFYLAKTIDMIGKEVDAVYFVDGWQQCRGCVIERKICELYDILILDDKFFKLSNNYPQIKRV